MITAMMIQLLAILILLYRELHKKDFFLVAHKAHYIACISGSSKMKTYFMVLVLVLIRFRQILLFQIKSI